MKSVKVVRINRCGVERDLIVNLDTVANITEIDCDTVPVKYDSETGEPVEFKEVKRYVVEFVSGKTYELTAASAETLIDLLLK